MSRYQHLTLQSIIILTTVLTLVLTAYKANQNAERYAHFLERDLKQKAAYELGREVTKRLGMAAAGQMTIGDIEEAFGPLTEISDTSESENNKSTHSLFHDKSQRTFYLRIQDGQLMGSHSSHGPSDIDTGVVLETRTFLITETVRTLILYGALIAWFIVLFIGIRVQHFRGKAFILLIVLSVVCGLCWFLAPNYSPTVRGILSNDMLAAFGLMFACSFAFGVAGLGQPLQSV